MGFIMGIVRPSSPSWLGAMTSDASVRNTVLAQSKRGIGPSGAQGAWANLHLPQWRLYCATSAAAVSFTVLWLGSERLVGLLRFRV